MPVVTRRHVLGGGLGGAALVAVCGVGVALQGTVMREPRRPLVALDTVSFSVLAAAADRLCHSHAGLPTAWDLMVPESADAALASRHPGDVAEMCQALWLVENALAGLVLDGRPVPFTAAEAAVQDRVLSRWRKSRIGVRRTAFKAIRNLCCAAYWSNAAVWNHTGYPGPPPYAAVRVQP